MSGLSASRFFGALALSLGLMVGCGSSLGGGCGMKPLPTDPQPLGFPRDQLIEGGIQARITKPGMDKLIATIPQLIGGNLANGFCAQGPDTLINVLGQKLQICESNDCNGGSQPGCPALIFFDSKDRPSSPSFPIVAANDEDGKDGIHVALQDGSTNSTTPPVINIDASFDVEVPIAVNTSGLISSSCTLYAYSNHIGNDGNEPVHINANINVGIDPTTGELTLTLGSLSLINLGLDVTGCGVIGSLLDTVVSFVSNVLQSFIGNFIINLLTPTLNNLVQSFLPKPLGLAGVLNAGSLFASFGGRDDANLEMFIVPGGYAASSAGGLSLGVMSGMNSDSDESTRTPGLTSEASLCVPSRPTPDLSMAPWMLPANPSRSDFTLTQANEFNGNPDPMFMGMTQDVALGISRTFLDLAGFHLYNSGTLCLAIGGSAIPQLNAGTIAVVVGSLGNIIEDRKAPLALVLRPQTPLSFTIGAGSMTDPLLHIAIEDMRIDFYAWIEERYVRILTLSLSTNIGLNLTSTMTPDGKPAIQPMIVGLTASNVQITVSNTDLLQEDPTALAQVFPSLINIATGALGGAIKPIALPSVAGFSLDNMNIGKVQTSQDDFLAIFAGIASGGPAPLIDWSDPNHPHLVGQLTTHASVSKLVVPSQAELRALFAPAQPLEVQKGAVPQVTLALSSDGADTKPVEWAWRIDNGWWHVWTQDPNPTITDDNFLLQGHHKVEVRSRVVNEWSTEDLHPVALDVLIDSVPPELHPALDQTDPTKLAFNGFDIVTDTDKLQFAWLDATGTRTKWSAQSELPMSLVAELTAEGARPLTVFASDEAGNVGQVSIDYGSLNGFHGRTTNPPASGCGCTVGGAQETSGGLGGGALVALGLAALVLLRRRKTIFAALALASLTLNPGCGCSGNAGSCRIDDDCAKMQCPAGQIATCQGMCMCTPDLILGDIGRFSSMIMSGPTSYVAAYNNTYGDLMIGHIVPPGVVTNWDFVDGVPDEPPDNPASHIRGGVSDKGDDVGRYTSIQITQAGDPVIAYFDLTHHQLKFASFGAIRWHNHVVDKPGPDDEIGRWASMSIGKDGKPLIAYTASIFSQTNSGVPEGQLRVAQANTTSPQSSSDWTITIVDARPLPMASTDGGDGGTAATGDELLPEGIGLMPSLARKSDNTPGIAYYDRTRGNLRYVEYDNMQGKWGTPQLLDGEDDTGFDTGDVGLYPGLAFDETDVGHISYEDATHDNLLYVNLKDLTPEVADDGYRPDDEQTLDGLNSPVYHLVGDSSSVAALSGQVVVAYQDSTALELRVAQRGQDGKWSTQTIAGHADPFTGSYGFYANLRISNRIGIISSYAINQMSNNLPFYVEIFSVNLGLIM